MPFNGSGTFNRLYSWVVDAATSVNISSTRTDAEMNGFAAGLTNCITRDGQSPPSADTPWGGKKITNLANATVATDALNMATGDARYTTLIACDARYLQLTGGALTGSLTSSGTITGQTPNLPTTGGLRAQQNATNSLATIEFINSTASATLAYIQSDGSGNVTLSAASLNCTGTLKQAGVAVAVSVSPTFTGTPLAPTATAGTNTTQIATTAYVLAAGFAPLASPTLTGTPAAPTAAVGTSTTQLATTAFVQGEKAASIQSVASAATVTPTATNDQVNITAQAAGLTIANPGSAPADGWGFVVRIKDNGTPRSISFGAQYRPVGVVLPTTTVVSKTLYIGCIWNAADTAVDVVSVAQQ